MPYTLGVGVAAPAAATRGTTGMGDRLGEQRQTGADGKVHGGPTRPRRARRWALFVVVLSVAALAWSCVFHGKLTRKPVTFLTTGDAVIALRIGRGWTTVAQDEPYYDGWIVLLDAQGRGQVASVDEVVDGDVLWSDRGVFFGSSSHDYVTTDSGTQQVARRYVRDEDVQRYELSGGTLAVVKEEGAGYRVDSVRSDGTTSSVDNAGVRGDVGQCGSRILVITDTVRSESIRSAAFEAYAAQSGGSVPEALTVVVQLTDHDGDTPPVLAVAPMIDGLSSRQRMFDCAGDVITIPSVQTGDSRATRVMADGREEGTMVLERWDLSTGQRTIVPVIDEQENPIEVNRDRSIFHYKGVQVGDEYRFISEGGDAFAVDLTSGRGRYLFTYQGTRINQRMVFQVSETGVYALEGRREDHNVTLSYRPWDGGAYRDVITMDRLADYVWLEGDFMSAGHWRRIQSFSLRPGWDGGAQ